MEKLTQEELDKLNANRTFETTDNGYIKTIYHNPDAIISDDPEKQAAIQELIRLENEFQKLNLG